MKGLGNLALARRSVIAQIPPNNPTGRLKMLRTMTAIGAFALVTMMFSTPIQAQSKLHLADSCRSECESNIGVCLKYLEKCDQPGMGCETRRAQCSTDTEFCYRTCR
jgi:hypothetical protein